MTCRLKVHPWVHNKLEHITCAAAPSQPEMCRLLLLGTKLNDVKPFTGAMFADVLAAYTHWGWIDIDVIYGDLGPAAEAARMYDVVTFQPGDVM